MSLLGLKASDEFFDSWEIHNEEARSETIRSNLDEYIKYCKKVPFYEDRLDDYNPGSSYPLQKIPVLNQYDLRRNLPPTGTGLMYPGIPEVTGHTVFQSGGTTGMPKTVLFSDDELEKLNLPNARGFYAVGLREQDRVANLFAVGGLYMTFIHINRMLQQYGCMNFPFANNTPAEFVRTVAKMFKVNCFTGITSVVLDCLRAMSGISPDGLEIRKVYYGGEHIYESDRAELKKKLGVETIAAPGYGTVESWYIGYQCEKCPPGVFHAHDDQVYIEVVDEETGKHCEVGEPGMIYVTAFPRRLTPVVRYRVGDRVRQLKDMCSCGRTTPLFKLLGRGDDLLRIGYDSVDYAFVQDAVSRIEGLSGVVQMEKARVEGRDKLIIRVETELFPAFYDEAAGKLEKAIIEARPSLNTFIEKGTVWPVQIELVRPMSLPRNPRTGKLIRIIDAVGDH